MPEFLLKAEPFLGGFSRDIDGTVLTEGTMLEVRIISTSVSRAAMRALRRLSGENPGEREEDWLEWWRERKMSL